LESIERADDRRTFVVILPDVPSRLPRSRQGFRLQVGTHLLPRFKKGPTEPGAPVEETRGDQVDLYEPECGPGW
jgi:hypothetical protein